MATLLDALETRAVAILEQARGASGLGSAAALRYVPAGWFRRSADDQSLREPGYPGERFDRAYALQWDSVASEPEPENELNSALLRRVGCALEIGYVYGKALPSFVHLAPGTTEATATAVLAARNRALSDTEGALRALCFPDIVSDNATDPLIIDCRRLGPTVIDDLGGGRLVTTTRLEWWIQLNPATRYWP